MTAVTTGSGVASPAELSSIALRLRNSSTLKSAAEMMLEAGDAVGLHAPIVVSDIRTDVPLQLDDAILSRAVWDWNTDLLAWWYGERVGLRHRDVQRATAERLPYPSSIYDGAAEQLSMGELLLRERMGRWGLRSLLLVPVHSPRGDVAVIGWSSHRSSAVAATSQESWFALIGVAHAFMDTVERSRGIRREEKRLLTSRQRECLALMSRGRTAKQVGLILGLSPHTVREFLKDAARRVNARTQAQLISIALGSGELDDLTATQFPQIGVLFPDA